MSATLNGLVDRRSALIVGCRTTCDVAAALGLARAVRRDVVVEMEDVVRVVPSLDLSEPRVPR